MKNRLNTMNLEMLKTELLTGSYSDDPTIAAEQLNAKTVTTYTEIVSGVVRGYLILIGKLFEIDAASKNPDHPARDIALGLMMTLQPGGGIDFSDSANIAALQALKVAFGMTDEDERYILSLGEIKISRAEELGLDWVRVGHVEKARAL